jgi:hypothetical protein
LASTTRAAACSGMQRGDLIRGRRDIGHEPYLITADTV